MEPQVLIIGAGPVGLAAALFLRRRGIAVRIVEQEPTPRTTSRAMGVNPTTLRLLEDTGVTADMLAESLPVRTIRLNRRGRPLATLRPDFEAMGAKHPMVILPQARSEALLARALEALDVTVERGVGLVSLTQDGERVTATLSDGTEAQAPVLFGADGARSNVRESLGLSFPGETWPERWALLDATAEGPPRDAAWIDLQADGAFLSFPFADGSFRMLSIGRPIPERLPQGWSLGEARWESAFRISHRLVERFSVGRVALGGDAAHIHSPVGARGMNLGIEDAYVFAACAADFLGGETGRLEDYHRLRHPIDAAVVRNVRRLTGLVRNYGALAELGKRVLPPLVSRVPALMNRVLKVGMGLDHPVNVR